MQHFHVPGKKQIAISRIRALQSGDLKLTKEFPPGQMPKLIWAQADATGVNVELAPVPA